MSTIGVSQTLTKLSTLNPKCSTIGVSQTLIQAKKRTVDVGATWKVAAESNVLMTEEEAKARLVLEIAYTEMKETKNSPPPGYDPQPVLKKTYSTVSHAMLFLFLIVILVWNLQQQNR